MSVVPRITERTEQMAAAIYAALDAIDAYAATVVDIAETERASSDPNRALIKRMEQFSLRASAMTAALEDQVLDHLNFCTDRLFSIGPTERGEFI